jgi:hypothetical protein
MASGVDRNTANRTAKEFAYMGWPYEFVWFVMELKGW